MIARVFAAFSLPAVVCAAALVMLFSRRAGFSDLTAGVGQGGKTLVSLLPTLLPLIVAVSMFRASGLASAIASWLSPLCQRIGFPEEMVPLWVLRPFSGSGSNALALSLFSEVGADGYAGFCASVLLGSSDTAVYILSVYFGAAGVTRPRYAYFAAIVTMLFCTALALLVGRAFY